MSHKPAERRHEARIKTLNLVNAAEMTPIGLMTKLETGRTLDLSHDGMRVELSHCLPLRSEVALVLAMGETVLELRGRVVSLQELDEKHCAMGIQFVDVEPESYERLDEYLKLQE